MRELNIRNFRDISGYQNQYGEIMRKNCIFRGGPLDALFFEEIRYMEDELGIRYILDYRDEREASLARDMEFPNARYERIGALQVRHARREGFDFGAMLAEGVTPEKIEFLMGYIREGYKQMAFDNPAYHKLFELLLRGDGHVYFHCSAGKDRTGVSAFLVMLALGMGEEDGMKEYLRSNHCVKKHNDPLAAKLDVSDGLRRDCTPLLYVEKDMLMLTIQAIKGKYCSYYEFLEKEYGIDEEKRMRLRALYCLPADHIN